MAVGKEQVDKFWVVGVPAPVFSDDPMLSIKVRKYKYEMYCHGDILAFKKL